MKSNTLIYLRYSKGIILRTRTIGILHTFTELFFYYRRFIRVRKELGGSVDIHYRISVLYTYCKLNCYTYEKSKEYILNCPPSTLKRDLQRIVCPDKSVLVSKLTFYRILDKNQIPYPKTLFYKKNKHIYDFKSDKITTSNNYIFDELFGKSLDGSGGNGALLVNGSYSEDDLPDNTLYQDVVKLHSAFLELADVETLNTVRVHSYLCNNGKVEYQSIHLKLAMGGIVDNMTGGAIAIPIDITSGRLTKIGYSAFNGQYLKHPIGIIDFESFQIPFWKELIEAIEKGHSIFKDTNRSIAWDVAITQNGPVIIEGNSVGDYFYPQAFIRPYLETKLFNENIPGVRLH